jgi:hypothetical protein
MRPVTIDPNNVPAALTEIQRASHENDVCEMAQNFDFDAAVTQTTTLAVGTPSLDNVVNVLGTLLQIHQRGGLNRTT